MCCHITFELQVTEDTQIFALSSLFNVLCNVATCGYANSKVCDLAMGSVVPKLKHHKTTR